MTAEATRLLEDRDRKTHWKRWGPYLSERQWGTVREDYSANGDAWSYFPFEQALSRTYRWGEDGIGGFCDRHQRICFALALWNGCDPFLKERLFGLTNMQGNHGEDVKEYYFYQDATPTSSYCKCLYKYPQQRFPYEQLLEENRRRSRRDQEFELLDTGIFNENRYFDVYIEYAKAASEDILIRITAWNRGPEKAALRLLPTLWFRNTWSWGGVVRACHAQQTASAPGSASVLARQPDYGAYLLTAEGKPELLFTENETNLEKLYGGKNRTPYVKDSINDAVVLGKRGAVNPANEGTKVAADYALEIPAGGSATVRLRLTKWAEGDGAAAPKTPPVTKRSGAEFERIFAERIREADEFFGARHCPKMSADAQLVQRQAFAGLLWGKQSYHYDVEQWLAGDPTQPPADRRRKQGRNSDWTHLYNADVISMPDKWEYPWYASWDLAFHCVAMALIDPDFAKEQLILLLREWYQHPNGQIPAYEWNFGDVNPPVQAWAALRVFKIERRIRGKGDRNFLERVFHKLLLNFTWWVTRKDPQGRNVFEGGFLGLDNIGVFDRSQPLPGGGALEQSDGTSWMAVYCLNLLAIAVELAQEDSAYEDVASKFFEHFVRIADAMNSIGGEENHCTGLWNEEEGFYYDVVHFADGGHFPLKLRSLVGLIPLFAVTILEPEKLESLKGFLRRMDWFLHHHADFPEHLDMSMRSEKGVRRLLSIANRKRLVRILPYMLSEAEFLSPHGIRSLSKIHQDHPYMLQTDGMQYRVDYAPGESWTDMFGGNSNWRGPVWMPMNFLIIESLQRYHHYYGDTLKVEYPTGSGRLLNLWDVAADLSRRLSHIFLQRDGRRPVYGGTEKFQTDEHWRNLILFYEYFHGENGAGLGASHQTGWTALIAKLLEQSGE
ncbi:MAG: MGH1-like glycoside hydrolase domain-containing protein [Candidatus Acidiferrales bacterium]